jgi:nucleotide-binding universal stress UspA family protein
VVRKKDVARAICETAERVGADVVCLAASSKSVVDRTLVGSVATQVLQQASRPVLLIRAPQP